MKKEFQPKTLDEAVDHILDIITKNDNDIDFIEESNENTFLGHLHMFFGRNLRNQWNLWWYENHNYENWPKEKPEIVQWFNNKEIYHADDMSGIILTTVHRKYYNKPIDLDAQIKRYHDHWLKANGTIRPS